MPKPKKAGRPKLPKGEAMGRVIQVRFTAQDTKAIELAANVLEAARAEPVDKLDKAWADAQQVPSDMEIVLPDAKGTYHFDPATTALAPAGIDSPITRVDDVAAANAARWQKMPYLMDYQDPGTPKPGAAVLAEMFAG